MKIHTTSLNNDNDKPLNGDHKIDYELYNEKDNIIHKLVRIKRLEDSINVYEDNVLCMSIDLKLLSKDECNYLKTVVGFNWMLIEYKLGKLTVDSFVAELKKIMGA